MNNKVNLWLHSLGTTFWHLTSRTVTIHLISYRISFKKKKNTIQKISFKIDKLEKSEMVK